MSPGRRRQHRVAWLALVALVGALLGSPFANAFAMRTAGAANDLCSAVAATPATDHALPGKANHALHQHDCSCCTGAAADVVAPGNLPPLVTARPSAEPVFPLPAIADSTPTARAGSARAPPLVS